jgi:hypothetical protein
MANLQTQTTAFDHESSLKSRAVKDRNRDRRDFPRYPVPNRFAVQLRVLPATEVIQAQILDLSRDGVGLFTNVFIAPGESVTFPVGGDWVVADVRHCRPYEGGFVVGGMITDIVYEPDADPAQ